LRDGVLDRPCPDRPWAVAYLRSRGAKTLRLYSTRLAKGLYRSLGFEEVTPRTVYRLEEGPWRLRIPDQVDGHRVETLTFGDLPELYGVDRWSYGADRSALLFATLRLHPGRGLVIRDSTGRIKGYLIRSARGRATRIGPFLASTPDVARLLLARALSGDRRYARPGHGPRSGQVPRALPLARVRLRGHRGPDADGAGREEGRLPYRPRPLRYDTVSSNLAFTLNNFVLLIS
jgi:hypothetical protein